MPIHDLAGQTVLSNGGAGTPSALAEMLRAAASRLREPRVVSFCDCGRRDSWFDRSVCPDPCGSMHDVCTNCGHVIGHCSWRLEAAQPKPRDLALAAWLEQHAAVHTDPVAAAAGCFDAPRHATQESGAPGPGLGCPAAPVAHEVMTR